jgi:hypothetical protein
VGWEPPGQGSSVVIRTYQAEHGGTVFSSAPTRRQQRMRSRFMAIAVIVAVAASAGMVQAFNDRAQASASEIWRR